MKYSPSSLGFACTRTIRKTLDLIRQGFIWLLKCFIISIRCINKCTGDKCKINEFVKMYRGWLHEWRQRFVFIYFLIFVDRLLQQTCGLYKQYICTCIMHVLYSFLKPFRLFFGRCSSINNVKCAAYQIFKEENCLEALMAGAFVTETVDLFNVSGGTA